MNKTYVQIGSGAGDLDPRADFRDGFTEYVKNLSPQKTNRIVLVEPNPINIPLLKKCWKDYPQAEIHQIGIRTLNHKDESLCFYFAVEDAPHYQVFSLNENHVRKHYPNGTILKSIIKTLTISDFFKNVGTPIEMLALDIEGIDAEIILEINWSLKPCKYLSLEYLHLGHSAHSVYDTLEKAGYVCTGWGLDHRNYDLMFVNPDTFLEAIKCRIKNIFGGWWRYNGEIVRFKLK